ncbi:unnamed protein product [Orchesella dallaii]|uniref:Trehalase n=2 Tax=Orchesella dallaii TaxID=48710 RepID=A0ABP1Q1Q9_9HEXA
MLQVYFSFWLYFITFLFLTSFSKIYCHGPLLHTVQMAGLHKDSKTFVDMKLKYSPAQVLINFDLFMANHKPNPTKADIAAFVDDNFDAAGSEFEPWDPSDWHANPGFLKNISDLELRAWADELHSFWKVLGRKIKEDVKMRPDLYSMIYTTHPVIVPGGRFREFFYWDSFWIMRGLLLSEMHSTVKGMLSNFLEMVNQLGYVPNGGRIYFRRSQPPLLIPMFKLYTDATNDTDFVAKNIHLLDKEFRFWMENRTVNIDLNGKQYQVVRYNVELGGPRPESYREDYELAETLETEEEKTELYFNLKSGAESGWDFSSRWFIPPKGVLQGDLAHTQTRHVIPVELNSFIYLNAKIMAEYYEQLGNKERTTYYQNVANQFKTTIEEVFWDEELGCWFDYDMINKVLRKSFYASNVFPLWVGAYSSNKKVTQVVNYLRKSGAVNERGGVPTSSFQSGEQWDYPNGWAPLQHVIVDALDKTGDEEAKSLAFELADKWIRNNYKAFLQSSPNHMFEKYDVTTEGLPGGGGEYDVVVGFGWTNGVVMDFLYRYGDRLRAPLAVPSAAAISYPSVAPATIAIGGLTIAIASLFGISQACRLATAGSKGTTNRNPNDCRRDLAVAYQGREDSDNEEAVALMQDIQSSVDINVHNFSESDEKHNSCTCNINLNNINDCCTNKISGNEIVDTVIS